MIYVFKVQTARGIVTARIEASGYFAAEQAVKGMYPGGRILSWDHG